MGITTLHVHIQGGDLHGNATYSFQTNWQETKSQHRLIQTGILYLGIDALARITFASHTDRCNVLYVGLSLKTIQKLQLVQNIAVACFQKKLPVGYKILIQQL